MNETNEQENKIVRPRLTQLELFILVELLKERYDNLRMYRKGSSQYVQVRKLYRKLSRNLTANHVSYEVESRRVPYVKSETSKENKPSLGTQKTEDTQTTKRTLPDITYVE